MSNLALSLNTVTRPQSLYEQTYQALRMAILSGELGPGDRLIETQLAKALQVSRTPIREALKQLQRERLLMADSNGGLRVTQLTVADAIHLYDCRISLEQLSVKGACQNIDQSQLSRIELVVAQGENIVDKPSHQLTNCQLLHIDHQFHRLLAEFSQNPWLVSLLDQVFAQMELLRIRTMQQNPGVLEIRQEHRRIYEAVAERDTEQAVRAIVEHLSASKERVIKEVQQLDSSS
jgi:DNA-binding GntR family transcriptional regulator